MASKLFQFATEAAKRLLSDRGAMRDPITKTTVGKLTRELEKYKRGQSSEFEIRRLMRQLERQAQMGVDELRGAGRQSGLPASARRSLAKAMRQLGPLGKVLAGVFEGSTGTFTDQEVRAATDLVRAFGRRALIHDPGTPQYREGIDQAIQALEDAGFERPQRIDPKQLERKKSTSPKGPTDEESAQAELPPQASFDQPAIQLSKVYRTPQSSNVYSFYYDYSSSTLYVRYKAPKINTKAVKNVTGNRMKGMQGALGSTVIGKTDKPGPMYAYYDVPVRVFERLKRAGSKGGAVWDNLRVRGTAWGHQFRYSLFSSPEVPGESGQMARYVPRKATRRGFRSRSLLGAGKKYVKSTLPEVQRGAPDRGRPDRGKIDRQRTWQEKRFGDRAFG